MAMVLNLTAIFEFIVDTLYQTSLSKQHPISKKHRFFMHALS